MPPPGTAVVAGADARSSCGKAAVLSDMIKGTPFTVKELIPQ